MPITQIPAEEYANRRRQAIDEARKRDFDALLIWSRGGTTVDFYGDVFYLTNHHSPCPPESDTPRWSGRSYSALVLPIDDEPTLIVDIPDYPADLVHLDDVRPTLLVPQTTAQVLEEKALARSRIGLVAGDTLLLSNYRTMVSTLGHELNYEPADDILVGLRQIKSAAEVELMRHAAAVGVEWLRIMMEAIEPGKTEGDIVGDGLKFLASKGGYPYDVAVASGPYSEHFERIGIPSWDSARPLERGDLIHIDAWGPVNAYFTDLVRSSVVGGEASAAQKELLEGSIGLVENLITRTRPGVTAEDLHRAGSEWLSENFGSRSSGSAEAGPHYMDLFPTFGHGLGLGLEPPWIMEGDGTVIQENMVLALEVMLINPGVGGAQFEQNVAVTSGGCEVLTEACPPKWWA